MTEYNNYILLSDHLTRERGGLRGYSQAESLLQICGRQLAKSSCINPIAKCSYALRFLRKCDAA